MLSPSFASVRSNNSIRYITTDLSSEQVSVDSMRCSENDGSTAVTILQSGLTVNSLAEFNLFESDFREAHEKNNPTDMNDFFNKRKLTERIQYKIEVPKKFPSNELELVNQRYTTIEESLSEILPIAQIDLIGSYEDEINFDSRYKWLVSGDVMLKRKVIDSFIRQGKKDELNAIFAAMRKENSQINLSYVDLSNLDLSRLDLTRANLWHSNLTDTNLKETILYYADLTRANLSYACLTGAKLCRATLIRADLTGADCESADLDDAVLTNAVLLKTNLRRAWMVRADLSGAILIRANLNYAHLNYARLNNANLRCAMMFKVNLNEAQLKCAILEKAYLKNANLFLADLTSSELSGAIFTGALLRRTRLSYAILEGADWGGADLTEAIRIGCKNNSLKKRDTTLDTALIERSSEIEDFFSAVLPTTVTDMVKEYDGHFDFRRSQTIEQITQLRFTFQHSYVNNRDFVLQQLEQENRSYCLTVLQSDFAELKSALIKWACLRDKKSFLNTFFSEFRAACRFIDLSYVNLSGVDLTKLNLEEALFYEADLSHSNLVNVNLRRAILFRSDFNHAELFSANMCFAALFSSNFSHCNFSYALMSGVSMKNNNVSHANFVYATLNPFMFDQDGMDEANLKYLFTLNPQKIGGEDSEWTCIGVDKFKDCGLFRQKDRLRSADLRRIPMFEALKLNDLEPLLNHLLPLSVIDMIKDYDGVNSNTVFDRLFGYSEVINTHNKNKIINILKSDLTDFKEWIFQLIWRDEDKAVMKQILDEMRASKFDIDLSYVNFRESDLSGWNLSHARLEGTNFSGARLEKVEFFMAKMKDTNFESAVLDGSNMRFAKIHRSNLVNASFRNVYLICASFAKVILDGAIIIKLPARVSIFKHELSDADWEELKFYASVIFANIHDNSLAELERQRRGEHTILQQPTYRSSKARIVFWH